jgi:hypothetical protein
MAADDLTTLAAAKAWLGLPAGPSPNDATLAALITAASRAIYAWLSRPALLPRAYSETLDGESQRVWLRQWPVMSVQFVAIDGRAIAPVGATQGRPGSGYLLQSAEAQPPGRPQALDIFGWIVPRGRQNVAIAYTAGYAVTGEAQTVPPSSPWQVTAAAPYGRWGCDLGVAYATNGAALTQVATAPAAGEYSVASGVYSFSAADAGAAVVISYGYVPQDVAQAATELVAERFRAADRIGLRSKTVGGQETVSFDTAAFSATVLALLQPYRRASL